MHNFVLNKHDLNKGQFSGKNTFPKSRRKLKQSKIMEEVERVVKEYL